MAKTNLLVTYGVATSIDPESRFALASSVEENNGRRLPAAENVAASIAMLARSLASQLGLNLPTDLEFQIHDSVLAGVGMESTLNAEGSRRLDRLATELGLEVLSLDALGEVGLRAGVGWASREVGWGGGSIASSSIDEMAFGSMPSARDVVNRPGFIGDSFA